MTRDLRNIPLTCLALLAMWASPLGGQGIPGNLKATANGPTTVGLTWTAAPNANGYVVQRGLGSAGLTRLTPDKIAGTSYSDATAPAGSTLRYRVKAVYPNGQPSLSDIASVTTPAAPANTASSGEPSQPPGQPTTTSPTATSPSPKATELTGLTPMKVYAPSGTTLRSGVTLTAVDPAPSSTTAPAAPTPVADPSGFTAALQGTKVVLTWQMVPGVGWYLLGGPGMGPNGQQVQGSSYTFDSPGPGQHQWTVASLAGQGQGPVNNWVNWPKASLSIESLTGNYRVMVVGIRAPHATADDWWSRDGKWDEVYVSAFVQTFDRTSAQLLNSRTVQSPIHGDINGFPAGSRVLAGSASDLGGIVNGDQVSPVLGQPAPGASGYPLLTLWQGPMTTSREVVVVHPVLWEADVGDNNTMAYNGWKQFFEGTPSRGWGSGLTNPDPQAPSWFQEGPVVRLSGAVDRMCLLERNDKDRPIGLEKYDGATAVGVCGIWLDHMLVLTRERIERALNDPYATGEKGLLELRLNDYYQIPNGPRLSDTNMQGDYVLVLRVERTS